MLISCADLPDLPEQSECPKSNLRHLDISTQERYDECIADFLRHPSELGKILPGMTKHFYSGGAFNLIQLVVYLLSQTGPANVFLASYSISQESIKVLKRLEESGEILSIRFLIDNRVRSINPVSFDFLSVVFSGFYRSCALHAKVALLWNDDWKISVVGSQNATHNPKLERGIIHTDPGIWDFDYKMLDDAFRSGAD